MINFYRHKEWHEFRAEIIEADGNACTECGRGKDEVVLQVHHKVYYSGKLPWEYAQKDCETLCSGCHAKHHGKIKPSNGWDLLFEDDLGDLIGECQFCSTALRYEFHIHHPHWEPMVVGTDCCDRLTGTSQASDYRKLLERKERFLSSPKWKYSPFGIGMKKRGKVIEIREENKKFQICINKTLGKRRFSNLNDAKSLVFDLIENGEINKFLMK